MAFSTDSLPTGRAFTARADAARDAAVTGLALLRRWNPKEPAKKDLLAAEFQLIKEAAHRIDQVLNGDGS